MVLVLLLSEKVWVSGSGKDEMVFSDIPMSDSVLFFYTEKTYTLLEMSGFLDLPKEENCPYLKTPNILLFLILQYYPLYSYIILKSVI